MDEYDRALEAERTQTIERLTADARAATERALVAEHLAAERLQLLRKVASYADLASDVLNTLESPVTPTSLLAVQSGVRALWARCNEALSYVGRVDALEGKAP